MIIKQFRECVVVVVDQACLKYLHNVPIKNAFQCLFIASPMVISLKTTVILGKA